MDYRYIINGEERTVTLEGTGEGLNAMLDGENVEVSATPAGQGCLIVRIGARSYPVRYARDEQGLHLAVEGWSVVAQEPGGGAATAEGAEVELVDGKQILVAPMPGQVVKVNVSVGDEVKKKQCLVIVEAMKMENELNTAIDGTVTAVHVEAGQQVDALQPLVEVTRAE